MLRGNGTASLLLFTLHARQLPDLGRGNPSSCNGRPGQARPALELPDDTPIENVRFSTRVRNALNVAGMRTIGEVHETSDDNLLSLQDLGPGSIAYLPETLGLPSTDAVRLSGKKPA